jgi:chlorosome envelope protein I
MGDLPLSKLRGLPSALRVALKARRITTCEQLLRVAGSHSGRRLLVSQGRIDESELIIILHRADLARVDGLGAVFGLILEELGVATLSALAAEDPVDLHARVREYNKLERISRRSPTPEEVAHWVAQARRLPARVEEVPSALPRPSGVSASF